MNIEYPMLLPVQTTVIDYARKMRNKHFDNVTIISKLINKKHTAHVDISKQEQQIAIDAFHQYNSHHTEQLIMAIMLDAYRKENDPREGQIVTDGTKVGFAHHVDYSERVFDLHTHKKMDSSSLIGTFMLSDFRKV